MLGLFRPSGVFQTLVQKHWDPSCPNLITIVQPNTPRKSLAIHTHTGGFGFLLNTEHSVPHKDPHTRAQIPTQGDVRNADGGKTDRRPGRSGKRDRECRDGAESPGLPGVLRPEHSGDGVELSAKHSLARVPR